MGVTLNSFKVRGGAILFLNLLSQTTCYWPRGLQGLTISPSSINHTLFLKQIKPKTGPASLGKSEGSFCNRHKGEGPKGLALPWGTGMGLEDSGGDSALVAHKDAACHTEPKLFRHTLRLSPVPLIPLWAATCQSSGSWSNCDPDGAWALHLVPPCSSGKEMMCCVMLILGVNLTCLR